MQPREQSNLRTGERLSKATLHSTLAALRAFFFWLAGQNGYRSRFTYSDADYFNLSDRDARIAKTRLEKPVPSLEQVRHVIETMPAEDLIQRRDRALVAFFLLTVARDGAVASLKLKHLDLAQGWIIQDAREVATKFGKSFDTSFSRWETMCARLSRNGPSIWAASGIGGLSIRCFRQHRWMPGRIVYCVPLGWNEGTGAVRVRSGRFSTAPSSLRDCRISRPIGYGTPWSLWARRSAGLPRNSRFGVKTSDTAKCSRHSPTTGRWGPAGKPS